MTVTIHPVPAPLLTAEEIEPWRAVPVAVAVDLVPGSSRSIPRSGRSIRRAGSRICSAAR